MAKDKRRNGDEEEGWMEGRKEGRERNIIRDRRIDKKRQQSQKKNRERK